MRSLSYVVAVSALSALHVSCAMMRISASYITELSGHRHLPMKHDPLRSVHDAVLRLIECGELRLDCVFVESHIIDMDLDAEPRSVRSALKIEL